MEIFVRIVKDLKPSITSAKSSIFDVWQGSEYISEHGIIMAGYGAKYSRMDQVKFVEDSH